MFTSGTQPGALTTGRLASCVGVGWLWCLFFENSTGCLVGLLGPGWLRLGVGLGWLGLCGWPCCWVARFFGGEFDPGSGRTLAACLTHASRAERPLRGYSSGERVSNT